MGELTPATLLEWGRDHGTTIFLVFCAIPILGTLASWIGRGGKTDEDGKLFANLFIGFSILAVLGELITVVVVHNFVAQGDPSWVGKAPLLLALGPPVCLAGCVLGIRMVFPLNELATVKTFFDVLAFIVAMLVVWFLLSKFRGWGIIFFGGIFQLLLIFVVGGLIMRRLWRRAVGSDKS